MFQNFDLGVFLLAVLPVLLAITVREVARGYTARYWGDNTAEQYGRLTLNPLPHIDLVGTIIVPLLTLMFTPFLFGWARPIPIDSRNFRNPRLPGVALPRPARCRIWRWLFCGAWFWC
ncbi:peptidase, M50 family [Neisseria meningitidis NM3147]|nr:peptidase, M50 family [Neisseria meningitidis NM3147]EOC21834.1 peptidase, M50 family [Neisseria meningitidis NM3147]EOC22974.1 peptidase, M50 family [Neisseria meningitidis NM3147]